MRLLKWIFQPVTLLLFIIVIALYINRETVFSDREHSPEVDAVLNKIDSLVETLKSEPSTVSGTESERVTELSWVSPETDGQLTPPVTGDNGPDQESDTSNKSLLPTNPATERKVEETVAIDGESGKTNDPAVTPVVRAEGEQKVSRENQLSPANAQPSQSSITADSVAEVTREEVQASGAAPAMPSDTFNEQLWNTWQQARLAAWNGDPAAAIVQYQKIISLQPDNYDAYGEMGNVMLRAGDSLGAAEAYYQAATRLNKTENRRMAWQLLNVIAGLSPQKADQLYQELSQN